MQPEHDTVEDDPYHNLGVCPYGDPLCHCPDGDPCHYVDTPGSPALKVPDHLCG